MKLAAIDIGSNAIRFQVSTVLDNSPTLLFKKLEYVRFPLRLGHDVFNTGRISEKSIEKFKKLMKAFKLLVELYEVNDYMFCATSAMRESENGQQLADEVKEQLGIEINIIDGIREAELINKAINSYLLSDQTYLHIDVGGGSTELNLFVGGKKIKTRSFKIGSVRVLEHHDSPVVWEDMEQWVRENMKKDYGKVTAVGTGGNISKIFELARLKPGKILSLKKVKEIRDMIQSYSIDERIYKLQMNPDRADVIIPASDIYIKVMQWAHSSSILVPEVGLKDGIMLHLYDRNTQQKRLDFNANQ
ncbi:Ppx/GppA phosphatase family protein [Chryseosolibacter indicus]|uniref:Phosphatase n=1 Tax=Chryseosolibacter indicus TaxID=2782351 RepID=A0ABS5VPA1_9BACT|nr:phosphatase [Chryseosolibacter indicus]MBT1703269.1 phosphatase [Chryseosolibacter indicus]